MMNIVGHTSFLKRLRELEYFTMDLGKSKIPVGEEKIKITDKFILKYKSLYNKHIQIFGRIGTIKFYTDVLHPLNSFTIHTDNNIYEIDYDDPRGDFGNYLINILKDVDNHEEDLKKEEKEMELRMTNKWVDDRDGKLYIVNQRLPRDMYMEELKKKLGR